MCAELGRKKTLSQVDVQLNDGGKDLNLTCFIHIHASTFKCKLIIPSWSL
jgi:hypothetical protein